MSRIRFGGVCALLIALASTAGATTIPVSIQGFIEANVYRSNVEGNDFVYRVSTAEGPLVIAVCTGLPCSVEQRYSGGEPSVQFGEHASWKGLTASEATGSILLAFLLNAVPALDQGRFTANSPVSLSGNIVARGGPPAFDELFRFTFRGKGPGTVSGTSANETVVQGAQFTVPGDVDVNAVPEPATLLLVGSAIGAVVLRRRARAA